MGPIAAAMAIASSTSTRTPSARENMYATRRGWSGGFRCDVNVARAVYVPILIRDYAVHAQPNAVQQTPFAILQKQMNKYTFIPVTSHSIFPDICSDLRV